METRKYYLDWLRVIAFCLLICFHAGLLYGPWSYNLKSPRLVPGIEQVLLVFSVWRMPLLFLISGVASTFLIGKLGTGGFALDRIRRLQPVILFGMLVVIPPQVWIELYSKGITSDSYLHFWWTSYLPADQTLAHLSGKTFPTWDHLWFLVYLQVYVLLFAGVVALGRLMRLVPAKAPALPLALLLIGPALWLAATNVWIDAGHPLTHALVDDWGGHIKWIGLFATGVACAHQPAFWAALRDHRWRFAAAAALLLGAQFASSGLVWSAVSGLYGWAAICTVCGFAYRYLNQRSALLSHLNEAVLPVYVLHQPILLLAAYWVFPLRLALPVEGLTLVAITGLGSLAIYEVAIAPFGVMRFLFGLKGKPRGARREVAAGAA
ncbi:acyltransferase family protein [Phenylobacterium sp. 20VBR1]|uniref:Acyltransferase family protein n=2 Tax=Phenylobacterium glaciei TaxID=2803784 RepID=A0A941D231_9CAUL|nr:acyltransferase family protein [Phenylobacterium glaciei]MBR7620855.1 acyltransferase family protein [Phenylobacterium glaciei]